MKAIVITELVHQYKYTHKQRKNIKAIIIIVVVHHSYGIYTNLQQGGH